MNRTNRLPSSKERIYSFIAESGIVSKAELLGRFAVTSSTLTRMLEEMASEKLILASGLGPSSGGRRPILYEINPGYGYYFGLEISRLHSSLGFFDSRMNPMSFTRWRMDESMTPERLVRHVDASMKAILFDHKIDPGQVFGVGIGAVGPLDREAGTILQPLHFPAQGWSHVPVCRMIEEATGFPARLENGANTALMGEHWAMRKSNPQHMLYVHAGVGLRSAMMSRGQIIHGSIDMEGAVGQMIVQVGGPRLQESGNFGALEAFASVQALEKQASSQAKMGSGPWKELFRAAAPDRIRYDDLLQALRQEVPAAVEMFRQAASYLGIGLANMINLLHPEVVILGGALTYSHSGFWETAIEIARKHIYYYPAYEPVFSKGELREDAVAAGAALMMWKERTAD
ncbi:ROK family protein [Cohnella caldifontis]|uniref:ROK family protein n=1 Tax=Cohnella caldifontis TaxID=3027471 RepID=UPI0023EC99CE|nr:ROK family protein [Cohnella sp. YIM B05605]